MERASRSKANKKSLSNNASTSTIYKKPTIDDLIAEISELKKEHQSIIAQNGNLTTENIKLKTEMSELKAEMAELKADVNGLYKDTDFLHSKINRLEQTRLLSEVEIIGVPEAQDEDLSGILEKLFNHVEHPSSINVICNLYRKKKAKNGLPGTIIASFNSVSDKNQFVNSTRKKTLTSSFMCLENHRPVYINEHLTKHNKYLFYLARGLRRKGAVKYAWTDHGNILVKIDDNTDSIIIDNVTAIERIRGNSNQTN
jgi:regulator of replication initiation timing